MKKWTPYLLVIGLSGCIGEDVALDEVAPEIRITNPIASLEVNTSHQFEYSFFDNVGLEADPATIVWSSSDEVLLTVGANGLALAHQMGRVTLRVVASLEELEADTSITFDINEDATQVVEGERSGTIVTTSSYVLTGSFTLVEDGSDLNLTFESNYAADTGLPGLYVYLTNNPNSVAGALEVGAVTVFTGAHQYTIPNASVSQYSHLLYWCKPFSVKVGDGEIN